MSRSVAPAEQGQPAAQRYPADKGHQAKLGHQLGRRLGPGMTVSMTLERQDGTGMWFRAPSSVKLTLKWRFGKHLDGKLMLERRIQEPRDIKVDPGTAVSSALGHQVSLGTAVARTLGRQVDPGTVVSEALGRGKTLEKPINGVKTPLP